MLPKKEEVRVRHYVNEMRFYVQSIRDESKKDKNNIDIHKSVIYSMYIHISEI